MSDLNNNTKKFNLPAYIQTPLFLYQDNRLEKPATLIASFFYSLHTAGQSITASTDYLCALANIHKRQLYNIFNDLEEYGYIKRDGFTNRKTTKWIYSPKSSIIVTESDTSALKRTSDQNLTASALQCTKLVHSNTLNLCTPLHTDIKEDTKENKKLTTVEPPPSSSSFFSEKQKTELLTFKIRTDKRSDELFLEHCNHHVESQVNDKSKYQRFTGLKNILLKLYEIGDHFNATGFNKEIEKKELESKIPTQEDFQNYKKCVFGFDWVGVWMQKYA